MIAKLHLGLVLEILASLALIVMGASALHSWLNPAKVAPVAQYAPAPPIPAVKEIHYITVPGPTQIVTVEKEKVVHDLKLPDEIAKDPDKQVLQTGQEKHKDGSATDAVAVMDTKTGKTEIEMKEEERPFFSFEAENELGISGGMGLRGLVGSADYQFAFMRFGNGHLAVRTELLSPPYAAAPVLTTNMANQADGRILLRFFYRW